MILHTPTSEYPKYCVCKIIKNFEIFHLKEVEMMEKFCCSGNKGIIKYYHHLQLDHLYMFIEDCFRNKSGFENIILYKKKYNRKQTTKNGRIEPYHILLSDSKLFNTQTTQLMDALNYIHKSGYVHCDIAPKNIFISNDMELRIADFGAVVEIDKYVRTTTAIYLSPMNYQKYIQRILIKAKPEIDKFALEKSLFEIVILENQINIGLFDRSTHFYSYMKKEINSRCLDNSIYESIISISKNLRYIVHTSQIKQAVKNQTSITILTLSESSYCNSCGNVVSRSSYEKESNLMALNCRHSYHKDCLTNILEKSRFFCPLCGIFIGTSNYKEYIRNSSSSK